MVKFKNGDRVVTKAGLMPSGQAVSGQVVGELIMGSGPPFLIVLLDQRLEGFPWSAMTLNGSMLDLLNPLDAVIRGSQPCPLCGEENDR